MSDNQLHKDLEALRAELNKLSGESSELNEKLDSLIADVEQRIENPDDESHHKNLVDNIKDTISRFETEHPRATAILNDIMVTLSNMGI